MLFPAAAGLGFESSPSGPQSQALRPGPAVLRELAKRFQLPGSRAWRRHPGHAEGLAAGPRAASVGKTSRCMWSLLMSSWLIRSRFPRFPPGSALTAFGRGHLAVEVPPAQQRAGGEHRWADSTPGRERGRKSLLVTVRFLVLWVTQFGGMSHRGTL